MTTSDERSIPLCVDLDDTLIRTDILWESVIQLWCRPIIALRAFSVLLTRGKAAFKEMLAREITIDPASLPYREDVLEYVRSQHRTGRDVILATATHRIVAQRVGDHLGLFRAVFATDGEVNLSGARKRAALESAFGSRGFDYIGDNRKDLTVFAGARDSLLVEPSRGLLRQASAAGNVSRVFSENRPLVQVAVRALRVHQWAKNALLGVPLLTAHMVLDPQAWASIVAAFCGFSFVASATYLVNDLVDLQSDRAHSQKRFRPLASGQLSIQAGLAMAMATGTAGFALAIALLPLEFVGCLLAYVVFTLGYSFDLKRRLLVDVLALAILYTLRIVAGGAAIQVVVSEWLLMFSLFIFISLAFLKRFIEIKDSGSSARVSGRGYSLLDLETIRVIGVTSGLISVLVFSLYISSPAVTFLYQSPKILWLMCPLLIYWIARIWFLAAREEVHHDPVVFALFDGRSYVVGAFGLLIIALATIGPVELQW